MRVPAHRQAADHDPALDPVGPAAGTPPRRPSTSRTSWSGACRRPRCRGRAAAGTRRRSRRPAKRLGQGAHRTTGLPVKPWTARNPCGPPSAQNGSAPGITGAVTGGSLGASTSGSLRVPAHSLGRSCRTRCSPAATMRRPPQRIRRLLAHPGGSFTRVWRSTLIPVPPRHLRARRRIVDSTPPLPLVSTMTSPAAWRTAMAWTSGWPTTFGTTTAGPLRHDDGDNRVAGHLGARAPG